MVLATCVPCVEPVEPTQVVVLQTVPPRLRARTDSFFEALNDTGWSKPLPRCVATPRLREIVAPVRHQAGVEHGDVNAMTGLRQPLDIDQIRVPRVVATLGRCQCL